MVWLIVTVQIFLQARYWRKSALENLKIAEDMADACTTMCAAFDKYREANAVLDALKDRAAAPEQAAH